MKNSMRLMVSAVTIPILIINANNSLYGQQHTSNSNYLIVTPDSFRIQAERLAEYRAQGGLSPELIILDTINNAGEESVSDSTLKELITRFWFQNEMEPEYVVLLGDWEIIPPHNDMYMDQLAYSDTWFATDLDGSIGSDSLFLAIGRFPVESNVQLKTYIDRLIRYETQIDILPWENRVLALAGDRNYLTSCIFDFQLSAIGDQIESSGMQFDLIVRGQSKCTTKGQLKRHHL